MNPFAEIVVWAMLLMILPFGSEMIVFRKTVDKASRTAFIVSSGVRRIVNIYIFITLIYSIGSIVLSFLIMLLIEIIIGMLLYRNILTSISLKKLIVYLFISNIASWTLIYLVFELFFL